MAGSFHIAGLSALQSLLGGIDVGAKAEANVAAAAAHLEGEIKARAPVDTGHLRGSYGSVTQGTVAYVGTNVEYALHQEYGTQHQSGTAHVRPALEGSRGQLIEIMGAQTIKDAFGGL